MKYFIVFLIMLILGGFTYYLHSRNLLLDIKSPGVPTIKSNIVTFPLMVEEMRKKNYPGGEINIEEELGDFGNYTVSIVSYPSESLKLRALMSVPTTNKPEKGFPVIILNHGFIAPDQYSTTSSYRSFFDFFAANGYIVLKPDYRGHDQSEGVATGGHFSPDYTTDVLNLLASVEKYPDANPKKIGMWAHSMGGNVTLRALVISKDIKAAVIAAGVVGSAEDVFYNWTRKVTETPPNVASASSRRKLVDQFGDPKQNPDFWKKVSAINYVDFIDGSVQLHAGTEDESVPKLFSDHLNEALKKAGKPVEYFEYEGGDHNFTGQNRSLILQRSLDFFDKYLKYAN